MVEYKPVIDIISSLGFPIAMSIVLIKLNDDQNDGYREDIAKMQERYEEMNKQFRKEINSLNSAIKQNTLTMVKLIECVKNGGDDN